MKKIIENLQEKDSHTKRRVAATVSFVVTFLIILVWFASAPFQL